MHADWIKSSSSNSGGGGNCVEIAVGHSGILVRDSKDPRHTLHLGLPAWVAFAGDISH